MDTNILLHKMFEFHSQILNETDQGDPLQKPFEKTRDLLRQYNPLDAAIALSVSELWPANTGSPIKHIFAWCVLLDSAHDSQYGIPITNYSDFKAFTEALYATWPEFTMLEDFSPETDWGQIRVRLAQNFVPMFYGSCIERTPDFVEAFRITYAHIPEAQAHMDLAVAMQAWLIDSIKGLDIAAATAQQAHVEVAPEVFWRSCSSKLHQIGTEISDWRKKAGHGLETHLGNFQTLQMLNAFENAVTHGEALPFLAVTINGTWVPMSVRSAPGVVIDHWAKIKLTSVTPHTHRKLAQFVAERFQHTCMGPLTLFVGDTAYKDHPISCIILAGSEVYLVLACDHASIEQLQSAVKDIYSKMRSGAPIYFRLEDGRLLTLSKDGVGPNADTLHIVLVLTQRGTALNLFDIPDGPARLLSLADFITIFDSLRDLDELERYWKYVDAQKNSLFRFSCGAVDLFASFKDTDGVLVEGAKKYGSVMLDPHWGTSWRFETLTNFWSLAPTVFPDDSAGWWLSPNTEGVVALQSRAHKAVAYSTPVGPCTVQTLMTNFKELHIEDARLITLFTELLADCTHRCCTLMTDIPLFQQPHVLFICNSDNSSPFNSDEEPLPIEQLSHVVTLVKEDSNHFGTFHLQVNARAVLAGLNTVKDGAFEVRCLLETLEGCHAIRGLNLPDGLKERLYSRALGSARYHIKVVERRVDIPDYVDPVIPSHTDYKLARKRLAEEIMELGLAPGRYELSEAKARLDPASARLRLYIENRLASFDRRQLLQAFIEQHDALLVTERMRLERTRQSLAHTVEYDRLDAVEHARKEFGNIARNYRYLLEKVISSPATGNGNVTKDVLRELVSFVDWYMAFAEASDILHNGLDIGGVEINNLYIPEVFYSTDSNERQEAFAREYAKSRLGLGENNADTVEGEAENLLASEKIQHAFQSDLGFDLRNMLTSLAVLSQAQRYGFSDELSLSYAATPSRIVQGLVDSVIGLDFAEAQNIVTFLTLPELNIRKLAGKDVNEGDVPYWERNKRIHRYAIRPLIIDGEELRWGAETVSRSMHIWMSTVRDGYLPADFGWPHVGPVIRKIKESIEKRLELRTEEIFRRHTPFVQRGIDFFRRFRREGFEDVGDFDVFAYWPHTNLIVIAECKYNQPPFTLKDGRRLRDRIFGKTENDTAGQFSRIQRRRKFLEKNRSRLLELLGFPKSDAALKNVELYVSRELHYWMVHPAYPVPTKFVRIDALDTWIKTELFTLGEHE